MNVVQFEQRVFDLEGVRIIIRAGSNADVEDYPYLKAYPQNNRISEWLASRVTDRVNGFDVVVVDGAGAIPNRKTLMKNLRDSYAD